MNRIRHFSLLPVLLVGIAAGVATADTDHGRIEEGPFTIPSDNDSQASAVCPGKTRAIGGGVAAETNPTAVSVGASGPLDKAGEVLETTTGDPPKAWHVAGFSNDADNDSVMRVFAICARRSTALIRERSVILNQNGDSVDRLVKCQRGERAVSGGMVQHGDPSGVVLASGPLDGSGTMVGTKSGDVARQWYTAIEHVFSGPRFFRFFVVCARDSDAKVKTTTIELDQGQASPVHVKCGRDRRALGGGAIPTGSPAGFRLRETAPLVAGGTALTTESGDVATEWYAHVWNRNAGNDRFVKVFAICAG